MAGPATLYEWDIAPGTLPGAMPPDTTDNAVAVTRDLSFNEKTGRYNRTANGDIMLNTGAESIRQAVVIVLRTLLGEWFRDVTKGMPFFQAILIKQPNIPAIRDIFKTAILSVDGVVSVSKIDLDFDRSARTLAVVWVASTDFGLIQGVVSKVVGQ